MNSNRRKFLLSSVSLGVLTFGGMVIFGGRNWGEQAEADERPGAFEISKSPAEWRKILSPDQYYILRQHGTERPGSSALLHEKRTGTYHCAGCELPVYQSQHKYESGTGWPSFTRSIKNAIGTREDRSFLMIRTEVHCRRCGGHFGHIFNDGPPPLGERHCLNGLALKFRPNTA